MKRAFRIRIHPAGAVLAGIAFLAGESHVVFAAFLALLLHEGAHLAAMLLCGVRKCSVELTPFGGMADAEEFRRLTAGKQIIIASAGIVCSALIAWICKKICVSNRLMDELFTANASLLLVNCLPVWPLDGARIILAIFRRQEESIRRLLAALAWMLGAAFVALALYGAWHGLFNPTLLLAGPYLCYASRMGLVSERVRKIRYLEQKLKKNQILPVDWMATQDNHPQTYFSSLVGRFSASRYHILCQLDSNGQLCRIWTENEMVCSVLPNETFDSQTQVDKGKAL